MPTAEYLIVAAGAFATGLALGPIIGRRARQLTAAGGIVAAMAGAALMWPPGRSILGDVLAFDLLGFDASGLDLAVTVLFGVATVLLSLAFGAAITGT